VQIGFVTSPAHQAQQQYQQQQQLAQGNQSPGAQQHAHREYPANVNVQQPPRPISRHNTPQSTLASLRNSAGGSSGSFVVVEQDAGDSAATLSPGAAAAAAVAAAHPGVPASSAAPAPTSSLHSVSDFDEDFERARDLKRRALRIAETGDHRLDELPRFEPALLTLFDELQRAEPDAPLVKEGERAAMHDPAQQSMLLSASAQANPTRLLLEQLTSVLGLYVKALSVLAELSALPPQRMKQLDVAAAGGLAKDALERLREEWQGAERSLARLYQRYFTRCQLLRRAMEEMANSSGAGAGAAQGRGNSGGGNMRVTIAPSAAGVRRGSVSISGSQSVRLDDHGSAEGGVDGSSASLPPAPAVGTIFASTLSSVYGVSAESSVLNEVLQACKDAAQQEFLRTPAHLLQAAALYKRASTLATALLDDTSAGSALQEQDRRMLLKLKSRIDKRLKAIGGDSSKAADAAQPQSQQPQQAASLQSNGHAPILAH